MTNNELDAIRRQLDGVVTPNLYQELAQKLIIAIDQLREENDKLEATVGNMTGHMHNLVITIDRLIEEANQAKGWVASARRTLES